MSKQLAVKQFIKNSSYKIFGNGSNRITKQNDEKELFTDGLAAKLNSTTGIILAY
jgi:hypothetical protein